MSAHVATVIGAHTRVVGDVSAEGDVVIDGRVEGSVRSTGQLTLGRAAIVTGALEAHDVRIACRLDRSVRAEGVIHLLATAEVHGDLEAARVVIDDGALFEGQVRLARGARVVTEAPIARIVPDLAGAGRRRAQRRSS